MPASLDVIHATAVFSTPQRPRNRSKSLSGCVWALTQATCYSWPYLSGIALILENVGWKSVGDKVEVSTSFFFVYSTTHSRLLLTHPATY